MKNGLINGKSHQANQNDERDDLRNIESPLNLDQFLLILEELGLQRPILSLEQLVLALLLFFLGDDLNLKRHELIIQGLDLICQVVVRFVVVGQVGYFIISWVLIFALIGLLRFHIFLICDIFNLRSGLTDVKFDDGDLERGTR